MTRAEALKQRIREDARKTYPGTRLDARAKEIAATGVPLMDAYKLAVDEAVEGLKR